MKRFLSVILAALMLAQTTALAAPTAVTVENADEAADSAFLLEEDEAVVDTAGLYEEYGVPDTFLNYDMSAEPSTFKTWAVNVGKITKTYENGELKVTPDVSGNTVSENLTVEGTTAEHKGIKAPISGSPFLQFRQA